MTEPMPTDPPRQPPSWDVPKLRQCLRCEATCHSDWSGERICARCKGTAAWRSGVPRQAAPPGRRG